MRRLLIVGNWKMNKTPSETGPFVRHLAELMPQPGAVEVVLAPPFPAIPAAREAMPASRPFGLAAQNVFWEDQGAYTGEVSVPMLKDLGCQYVILGHSERRKYFMEEDEGINRKVLAALGQGLNPILCVGESLDQREAGNTESVVTRQLTKGLEGLGKEEAGHMTLAYEPVWAIGTGLAATVAQAETVHALLRRTLVATWGSEAVEPVRIMYGGSVTPTNAGELLRSPEIDGALVGGACLNHETFAKIIQIGQDIDHK